MCLHQDRPRLLCTQEALASAPLVGDLAGIKAGEEFSPSSKAEKHAARLHAEAGRLYNEEE